MQKKQTIDGMAYEKIRAKLPKTSNSAQAELTQARKAYELAKSDAKKIIRDARRQRRQARLQLKIAKMQVKLVK